MDEIILEAALNGWTVNMRSIGRDKRFVAGSDELMVMVLVRELDCSLSVLMDLLRDEEKRVIKEA